MSETTNESLHFRLNFEEIFTSNSIKDFCANEQKNEEVKKVDLDVIYECLSSKLITNYK